MKQLLDDFFNRNNIRSSLSGLRAMIKDKDKLEELRDKLDGRMDDVVACLNSEDAKTRKNAVLLLGDLEYEPAKDIIYQAYLNEQMMFVKEAYLSALSKLDAS